MYLVKMWSICYLGLIKAFRDISGAAGQKNFKEQVRWKPPKSYPVQDLLVMYKIRCTCKNDGRKPQNGCHVQIMILDIIKKLFFYYLTKTNTLSIYE